jgi:hypothetical protein
MFINVPRQRHRRARRCLALLACLAAAQLHAAVVKEYQLKAAFLFNFTKFVKWAAAPADATTPITIGVLGRNPFDDAFALLVQGRKVNGRDVIAKTIASATEAATVNVLFVPAGEEALFQSMRGSLQSACVLTVGESEQFAALDGMITFATEGGKIHFEINMDAAQRSHVKVSAELQKLARSVRRAGS